MAKHHQHSIQLNTKQLTELGGIAAKAILTQEWGWDLCNNLAREASRLQKQNIAFGGREGGTTAVLADQG